MAEDVKVPAVGKVNKKWVYAGLAAVAGIAAYSYISRSRASAQDAEVAPEDQIDPLTGLPYSASVGGSDAYVNPNPVTQQPGTIDATGGAPTNNQEWAAQVTEALTNLGYDPAFISSTLGKYLANQGLTQDEAQLIRTAWAYKGYPPNGPTTIKLATDASTPGSGGALSAPSLTAGAVTSTTIQLSWTAVTGAVGYDVYRNGNKVGSTEKTSWKSMGLKAGTTQSYFVKATAGSTASAPSNTVTATTTAAAPKPDPGPDKPKPSPSTSYHKVIVVKYTSKNPPWNSTISGIASHYGTSASAVWDDPKNAALVRKRQQPDHIQPGDTVYVKK